MDTIVTERDVAILLDLYSYRYLTFSQLARLHFPSSASAYQRLRILKRAGYVKIFNAPAIPERIFLSGEEGGQNSFEAELDTDSLVVSLQQNSEGLLLFATF